MMFMIIMTIWALIINQINFINAQNWLLIILNATILIIAVWVIFEGLAALLSGKKPSAAKAEA